MSPEEFIIKYLEGKYLFTSPTEIGLAYGIYKHGLYHNKSGYHSAWATPRCKKLVALGVLERNKLGHYRIKNA